MKQRHIVLSILSCVMPWTVILIKDDPFGALIALALQASIIGWIPASIWAWRKTHEKNNINTTNIIES